jgi:hypothetical protein
MATTTTPNLGLTHGWQQGEAGWGDAMNTNLDLIDAAAFASEQTLVVNVKASGALGDGATNDTAAIVAAMALVPANGILYFPAGTYRAYIQVWRSNITVMGAGSSATTIKLPDNQLITVDTTHSIETGAPSVIDVGKIWDYDFLLTVDKVAIIGMTIDGNKANNAPSATPLDTDLWGWGLTFTQATNHVFSDVVVQNCSGGGVGVLINSNYGRGNCRVVSCGTHNYTAAGYIPGFDINSSSYGVYDVISATCAAGARVIDNSNGNYVRATITGTTENGFIYGAEEVNHAENNEFHITINGGCHASGAVQVGRNTSNSLIFATIQDVLWHGFHEVDYADTYLSRNNIYNVTTSGCRGSSCIISGFNSIWNITSRGDGLHASQGIYHAVDVQGSYNILNVSITEGATWQVRGIEFGSASSGNILTGYSANNIVTPYTDLGGGNTPFPSSDAHVSYEDGTIMLDDAIVTYSGTSGG